MFVLLALSLVSAAYGAEICCPNIGCMNDNPPFDHLPLPQCQDTVRANFNLFTRSNPVTSVEITRGNIPSEFSSSRQTMFIIHGWNGDRQTQWLHNAKDALLDRGDYNAIVVGWGGGANDLWYPQSASNTRTTGREAGDIARMLVEQGGLSRSNLYCIGHSLGGHACGFTGKRYHFDRISGLDPAGPWFEESAAAARLDSSDANFVDIMHTQIKDDGILELGIMRAIGHVDHYPNGGGIQPGCFASRKHPKDPGQTEYVCSHNRAPDYYVESVNNDCFLSRTRCTDPRDIPNTSCSPCGGVCQSMGFSARNYEGRGLFYLATNDRSPYCQG